MAGTQLGKTTSGAMHTAYHLTGRYPDWYEGRRFDTPINMWAGGVTAPTVRDTIQKLLFGDLGQIGTGTIPESLILKDSIVGARGVPGAIDRAQIKHESGGISTLGFKNYEQGRLKWQSSTLHCVWFDEEPDSELYTEGLARTNATNGLVWMTFTPLLGMTKTVKRFLSEPSKDRQVINMTINDVVHYSEEQKQIIINSYPHWERDARLRGIPMAGEGMVFQIAEELITCEPFKIPFTFKHIAGLDFGWDHPTAAAKLVYDPDADIVYVTHVYRKKEATPLIHVGALKGWGEDLYFAWPHDGLQHDKGSGEQLADTYRKNGLKLLPERATFPDGSNGVTAGLAMMLDRMQTGRFKVFNTCTEFFEEFRRYHMEDHKVVPIDDDILCACLHPETEVITSNGVERIMDLLGTEGKILTINGEWADYKNCRVTKRNADIVRVVYSDGHELLCTPDHKFLSNDGDWIQAIDSSGMICHNAISNRGYGKCQKLSIITEKNSIHLTNITEQGAVNSCTGPSGSTIMGLSQSGIISTIKTIINPIMTSKIWKCFGENIISPCIKKDTGETQLGCTNRKEFGENLKLVKNSCQKWVKRTPTLCWMQGLLKLVSNAKHNLLPRTTEETNFVQINAGQNGGEKLDLITVQKIARPAVLNSNRINTQNHLLARFPVEEKCGSEPQKGENILTVLRVENVNLKSDVICLEVPSTQAFAIANGAIVHNCRYALMMLRYAKFKPIDKIREEINEKFTGTRGQGVKVEYNPLSLDYLASDKYDPNRM